MSGCPIPTETRIDDTFCAMRALSIGRHLVNRAGTTGVLIEYDETADLESCKLIAGQLS
jgi:hypothetical protein